MLYKDKPFGYLKGTVFTKHPKTALIVLNYGKVQYVQNLHILLRKERHTNVMTIEGNIPDAISGYHLTLIFFSFFYFCSIELRLLMDAYFRICRIFATRTRKSLIELMSCI